MNPFEDNETIIQKEPVPSFIQIWITTQGRKKNTYVKGWILPENELLAHIKTLKKKYGCNGTLKKHIVDSCGKIIVEQIVQFQGNQADNVYNYLLGYLVLGSQIQLLGNIEVKKPSTDE
jgi:translation initiation factor 1 (eIF-1/SUI1)